MLRACKHVIVEPACLKMVCSVSEKLTGMQVEKEITKVICDLKKMTLCL